MPLLPLATFLAGALLSLLIPAIMLCALALWYLLFIRRVPETGEGDLHGLPDSEHLPEGVRGADPPPTPADVST